MTSEAVKMNISESELSFWIIRLMHYLTYLLCGLT